ncbi:hypothetical protein EDB87DRAFT_1631234 [Lactarius vividus]|nr:hypothetical protein EDB87DRAFT_1631234 [Lactarius vividus]
MNRLSRLSSPFAPAVLELLLHLLPPLTIGSPPLHSTLRLCGGSSFQERALLPGLLRCSGGSDDRGRLGYFCARGAHRPSS